MKYFEILHELDILESVVGLTVSLQLTSGEGKLPMHVSLYFIIWQSIDVIGHFLSNFHSSVNRIVLSKASGLLLGTMHLVVVLSILYKVMSLSDGQVYKIVDGYSLLFIV